MSSRTKHALLLAAAFTVVGSGPMAMAAEPSGIAIKVRQGVDVLRTSGQLMLREETPVFMGDVIRTDGVGETQIRLSDNTRLVVGPNSLMTIDRFVLSSNSTASRVALTAVRGAFRFITGSSPKNAYSITTPTATIGVRGTQLDFTINRSGTSLAVFEGAADMCERQNRSNCQRQVSGCGVAVAAPSDQVRQIKDKKKRIDALTTLFPFVIDQRRLNQAFQVNTGSCGIPASALRRARIEAALETNPIFGPSDRSEHPSTTGSIAPPPPPPTPPPPPPPPPPTKQAP